MDLRLVVSMITITLASCSPDWRYARFPDGGFSVEMPNTPRRNAVGEITLGERIHVVNFNRASASVIPTEVSSYVESVSFMLLENRGLSLYTVYWGDFVVEQRVSEEELLNILVDWTIGSPGDAQSRATGCSRKLLRKERITTYTPERVEFWFEQSCDVGPSAVQLYRTQIFVAGRRLFGLQVSGAKAGTHSELTYEEASSEDAQRFFTSFARLE